jgi:putative effector of murein hydrolase LrgA (UPF0299 family)
VTGPADPPGRAPAWDAPVTVSLLALGVLNVTQVVAAARDLPAALDALYVSQGIGQYTQVGLATAIGWAVIIESVLSLVLAIGFAVPRMRAHRRAFWIPVAAAVVGALLTFALVSIAILADPAYAASQQRV